MQRPMRISDFAPTFVELKKLPRAVPSCGSPADTPGRCLIERPGTAERRICFLSLFLAVCCTAGFAQSVTPSITIGTHVLTEGMSETIVLEQLGTDLQLQRITGAGTGSSWAVSKREGSLYHPMGSVYFDAAHHLRSAMCNWEVDDTSSKSLFYALDSASKSLEKDGLTNCQVYTTDKDYSVEGGSLHVKEIVLECGPKRISISLSLSDSPSIASGVEVSEWLHSK